jgi:hypothetical protein
MKPCYPARPDGQGEGRRVGKQRLKRIKIRRIIT